MATVTDPRLIERLNQAAGTPVTDPDVIAALDAMDMGGRMVTRPPKRPEPEFDLPDLHSTLAGMEPSSPEFIDMQRARLLGGDEEMINAARRHGYRVEQDRVGYDLLKTQSGEPMAYINLPGVSLGEVGPALTKMGAGGVAAATGGMVPGLARFAAVPLAEGAADLAMQAGAGKDELDFIQAGATAAVSGLTEAGAPLVRALRKAPEVDGVPVVAAQTGTPQQRRELASTESDRVARRLQEQREAIRERLGAADERDAQSMGGTIRQSMLEEREAAESAMRQQYKIAESYGGEAGLRGANFGDFREGLIEELNREGIPLDEMENYPGIKQALNRIDSAVDQMSPPQATVLGPDGRPMGVSGQARLMDAPTLEQQRKSLNRARETARAAGNRDDVRGVDSIRRQFDAFVDQQIADGMAFGDPQWLKEFQEARGLAKDFYSRFLKDTADPNDLGGEVIEKIMGAHTTPEVAAGLILGAEELPSRQAAQVVKRVRSVVSPEAFDSIRTEVLTRTMEGGRGATQLQGIRGNLNKLFNDRKDLVDELFTPNEISQLERVRSVLGSMQFDRSSGTQENLAHWLQSFALLGPILKSGSPTAGRLIKGPLRGSDVAIAGSIGPMLRTAAPLMMEAYQQWQAEREQQP